MISKNLDVMLQTMERSTDKEWAVEAEVLRFDVEEYSKKHACYRCQNANWLAEPASRGQATLVQKTPVKEFGWSLTLGGCRAFQPVALDQFPRAPFFCSGERSADAGMPGGLPPAAAGAWLTPATQGSQVPRPRGQGQGQGE